MCHGSRKVGLNIKAEWTTITVISKGMPCPPGQELKYLPHVLGIAISDDDRAVVVYSMDKSKDTDRGDLPRRAHVSDLVNWCYMGFAKDTSKLEFVVTQYVHFHFTKLLDFPNMYHN